MSLLRPIRSLTCLVLCLAAPIRAEEGGGLKPDSAAIEALLQEAQSRRAAETVIKRLEPIRRQYAAAGSSKFSRLRQMFEGGIALSSAEFKGDLALAGQCVTRNAEETFLPGLASLYVERDPLLGKQIYLVPKIGEETANAPNYMNLDTETMRKIHEERRREKDRFSALQFSVTANTGLSDLLMSFHKESVFFTYRLPGKKRSVVLFNARMGATENGKRFIIVQRLCPYYPGCAVQGNNIVEYLNYVDTHAFCYYTRMHYFPKSRT